MKNCNPFRHGREYRARLFPLDSDISLPLDMDVNTEHDCFHWILTSLGPNSMAALSMASVKGLTEKVDSTHLKLVIF